MQDYPYFKCYLCQKCNVKQFLACASANLDFSKQYRNRCLYGTGLSIYKWFMRCLVGSAIVALGVLYIIAAIYLHRHGVRLNDTLSYVCAIFVAGLPCGIIIFILIPGWFNIHEEFRSKRGKVFGREE